MKKTNTKIEHQVTTNEEKAKELYSRWCNCNAGGSVEYFLLEMAKWKDEQKKTMMRYIVLCKDKSSFFTDWYDYENFYNSESIYAIIDLSKDIISYDGKTWNEIEEDTL